ncbi:MAG: hypothetical protein RIR39_860 [Pseudomonadota bacterium]
MPDMDTSVQVEDNFPIHAYLSYRCKIQRDKDARDRLKALCLEKNITLRYDESETEEGDSLIEFMEDLTSARCVFLFLSPEYFQSAYTLFELIKITEQADLDKSFIIPLRLSEAMVTYQWTTSKNYFDDNEAVRNELVRLLKKYNVNHDNLWQRIDKAWETIIFPHLDRLNVSLENANADIALGKLLGKTQATVKEAINESTKTLRNMLIDKIKAILNRKNINADDMFREELGLSSNDDINNIVTKLVTGTEVGEAIAILTRVVEDKKVLFANNSAEWKACFYDAEQFCGWLLLNSVDPVWWFHNEIKLEKTAKSSITGSFALHDPNYIEIVISRSLLQNARYILDINKQPKPASHNHDVLFFDAQENAIKETLLTDIYKDLFGLAPSMQIDVLSKIATRAKTHHKTQKGKLIYYLVKDDYLESLQNASWYPDVQNQLAGYLQFICCGQPTSPNERPASVEDQAQLLDQVANLLSLEQ